MNRWLRGITNPPAWLSDPVWALPSVTVVYIWQSAGFAIRLFLAGRESIDSRPVDPVVFRQPRTDRHRLVEVAGDPATYPDVGEGSVTIRRRLSEPGDRRLRVQSAMCPQVTLMAAAVMAVARSDAAKAAASATS